MDWIRVVKEHSQSFDGHYQVCNLHFNITQIIKRTQDGKATLKTGAIPTIFEGTSANDAQPEQSMYDPISLNLDTIVPIGYS